ncbi:MAG: glutamate-5-semialdehyde dehydrogenase [Parvularculaceae bacterium]|nr:glutamate-5-semialdehyde dehydrogenase [Parvularculaceae bacterium]
MTSSCSGADALADADYDALGRKAREAARATARATATQKDAALRAAARALRAATPEILKVNAREVEAAQAAGEAPAFLDRLRLDALRVETMARALEDVAALPDPVGEVLSRWTRPNGLAFERVTVPIGVIAVIYESRPNVTVDAAAIAVKAGNAVILRGGAECFETSQALARLLRRALAGVGLPEDAVQFVETADRAAVGAILGGLGGAVDLVIPRGGRSLVARVRAEARAPTLGHYDGLCHVYLDQGADLQKAVAVTLNSKMRRTGVCGAAETLLIDRARLSELWPPVAAALRAAGCELRGDAAVRALDPAVSSASEEDWHTEYLAPVLSVAAVDGVGGAIAHIARYGAGHTESIVTENAAAARRFLDEVDSAIVLHNASTQFADGGEFGFGAEIGIATGRLHARGPVGVRELVSYKTVVRGNGQIRP